MTNVLEPRNEDLVAALADFGNLHPAEATCYLRCLSNGIPCHTEALLHWHGGYKDRQPWELLEQTLCWLARDERAQILAALSPEQETVCERLRWRAASLELATETFWVGYTHDTTPEVQFAPLQAQPWLTRNGCRFVARVLCYAARFRTPSHEKRPWTGPWHIHTDPREAVRECIDAHSEDAGVN